MTNIRPSVIPNLVLKIFEWLNDITWFQRIREISYLLSKIKIFATFNESKILNEWKAWFECWAKMRYWSHIMDETKKFEQCMLSFLVRALPHQKYAWVRFQFHRGVVIPAFSASRRDRWCNFGIFYGSLLEAYLKKIYFAWGFIRNDILLCKIR